MFHTSVLLLCTLHTTTGVYGAKQDIRKITADEMLAVYTVNTVGPLLVVQQLLEAGLIGGLGGKTLVANVTSKVRRYRDCMC